MCLPVIKSNTRNIMSIFKKIYLNLKQESKNLHIKKMQGLKSYNCRSKFSCVSVYAIFVKMLLIMKFNESTQFVLISRLAQTIWY